MKWLGFKESTRVRHPWRVEAGSPKNSSHNQPSIVVLGGGPAPRDYQDLSRAISAELQPGDFILTRRRDWACTPVFYYLDHSRLVAEDFSDVPSRAPRSRVWVRDKRSGPTVPRIR